MPFTLRALLGLLGVAGAVASGLVELLVGRDRPRLASRIMHRMGRLVCPAIGVRLHVDGIERLAASQPCVYVANHQSFVDYPVLGSIYPERTVVLGRANLARMPIIGRLYRATGNLLVDRADGGSRQAALAALLAAVRAGQSVWVFPEGTRNRTPGTLLPFHAGAFRVASEIGVPVVPIVVEPLRPRTDVHARRLDPRTLRIRVLEPVLPDGRGARALGDVVRGRMLDALEQFA